MLAASFLMVNVVVGQDNPAAAIDKLQEIAVIQKSKDIENYSQAVRMAGEKNWPMAIKGKEGRIATLVGVDAAGFPVYFESFSNVNAAATIGTNKLWVGGSSGLNLSGNTPLLKDKLGIWDGGGVNSTHQELVGRVTAKDGASSADGHATHVAGTMIASGVSSFARGMAYGIPGMVAYTFSSHLSEMAGEAPNLYVSNHSYGTIAGWRYNDGQSRWEWYGQAEQTEDYKFGFYSSESQFWDSLAYLSPNYLIVKSSGNNRNESGPAIGTNYWRYNATGSMISAGPRADGISNQNGYDLLPTYSTSKNILTVGNVQAIPNGYSKPTDVVLSGSSSVGPTDDGRIKPDVVANGTSVTSTYTGSDNAYATLSGTSMSSPTVSGSSILLQEIYLRKNGNNPAWSSTIRGLVIHTTDKANTVPGPDYMNGWGLANFNRAALMVDRTSDNVIQQRTLSNGGTYSINVVASGKEALKATICWTDPPGPVNSTNPINDRSKKLIHDLDIRVKRAGRVHLPWKLDVSFPSLPATRGDNDLDNVEVIEIDSTVVGETYTIEVTHKGSLTRSGTQTYSLLISGVGGKTFAASAATSSAGGKIDSLSFAGILNQNSTGCKTYSDFRHLAGAAEVGQSVPFFMKVASCDASNATKYAKVFIDFNNDGDFDDSGENAATSPALTNNGTFNASISIPNTLTPGTLMMMRVVMAETASAANVASTGTYTNGETQDYQFRVATPSNDLAPGQVIYPQTGECAAVNKFVTILIRNIGTVAKTRIPIEVDVRKGTTLVTTLKDTCKFSIPGQTESEFTLQRPFNMESGANYGFTVRINLAGDQLPANNESQTFLTTSPPGATPTDVKGVICNNTNVLLKANVAGADSKLTWFTTASGSAPFQTSSSGGVITTTNITADKKYYVSTNEISGSVGPANKMVFPSGGYNEFSGNFVRFSNQVPMLIESVKMYIANPGKINIILADIASENGTGGYSYYNRGSRTFNVTNSRPVAQSGVLNENNPTDTGMIFNLNFQVIEPGNHILIMQCSEGATVFRNNSIATNPYPQRMNGNNDAFAITGNGVVAPSDPNTFYYFFYDMKVSSLVGCPSPRVPITVANKVVPVISQNGNLLSSNVANGNQWRLNGGDIPGATNQTYTAAVSGLYAVANLDDLGCIGLSNELNVVVTSVNNIDPAMIGLLLAPNPNKGAFNVRFRVKGREDLNIAVLNVTGQQVYQKSFNKFSGEFNDRITLNDVSPGIYMLKITHGQDHYIKRLLIN